LRTAGVDYQVGKNACDAGAVRVAAEDGHGVVGVGAHEGGKAVAGGATGKVREPVVIRYLAFVPAGLPEGRHVREYDHVSAQGQRFGGEFFQKFGRFVSESIQLRVDLLLGEATQFTDQDIVVQHYIRAKEVAEASVGPGIVADQGGVVGQRDHTAQREPSQPLRECRLARDSFPDRGDGAVVKIVIAEDEVDRNPQRGRHFRKEPRCGIRFADVAAKQEGVGVLRADPLVELRTLYGGNEVQVNVGDPGESQGPVYESEMGNTTTLNSRLWGLSTFGGFLPLPSRRETLDDTRRTMATEQMNISMPPQMARFIRDKVKAGEYTNVSEAIRDAVRRMQEAEASKRERALLTAFETGLTKTQRESIRRGVRRGIKDIEEGRYEEYDADGLRAILFT